ncbi:hypothetical protein E2C01_089975 [Portunus trituberculatus]|uniref:Uncharacterized protein n=1 Tax=Portunus trituberculatus TaxID=210409 RepID=A0A5B7JJ20_PORTR|nr:hypothetical protein [Portunus trituberculatus]
MVQGKGDPLAARLSSASRLPLVRLVSRRQLSIIHSSFYTDSLPFTPTVGDKNWPGATKTITTPEITTEITTKITTPEFTTPEITTPKITTPKITTPTI